MSLRALFWLLVIVVGPLVNIGCHPRTSAVTLIPIAPTAQPSPVSQAALPMPTVPSAATDAPTLPEATPTGQAIWHTVQPDDTLYDLALRYGTTLDRLAAANNLADPSVLQVGQILRIPGAEGLAATPTPTEAKPAPTEATSPPTVAIPIAAVTESPPAPPSQPEVSPGPLPVPAGYTSSVYAVVDGHPTSIAFGPDGALYVATQEGAIFRILEPWPPTLYRDGFDMPLGLAWRGPLLYVSSRTLISIIEDQDGDGYAEERREIIEELPCCYAVHQNNGIAFGPDGYLYIAIGALIDNREQRFQPEDPLEAGILRANVDGTGLHRFASGLRNPYDLAFDAQGRLFATDNAEDAGGPDELNYVVEGGHYGFPYVQGIATPDQRGATLPPIVELPEHAVATGITIYSGNDAELGGDIFITLWNRVPEGQKLVRVRLIPDGGSFRATISDFASGFDQPIDVVAGPDGALYVADFWTQEIFRIEAQP